MLNKQAHADQAWAQGLVDHSTDQNEGEGSMPKDSVAHPQRTDGVRGIETPENPPAFPKLSHGEASSNLHGDAEWRLDFSSAGGMELRDYFAAAALDAAFKFYDDGYCGNNGEKDERASSVVAGVAYEIADAMLRERAKRNG